MGARWRAGAVLLLLVMAARADYVWDGEEWKWQDVPAAGEDLEEGSGAAVGGGYHDDEDDTEGSADDNHNYNSHDDGFNNRRVHEDSINVDSDEEIDPNEVDIGFHEEAAASPAPPAPAAPTTPPPPQPTEGPQKKPQGETNFFAQPGILAAVVGGTVVGLLCTILLVMLIVYRMRKADEGSYSLNEPKRSPNVHSYLKAPTREFFA